MHLHGNYETNIAEAYNLINSGKVESAITLFEKLTTNYPSTAKGFHLKAFAYVKSNNLEKAHESIVKANKLMPNSLDISLDYSNILNSLGRKEEAFNILKVFDKDSTKDNRVFYNLGCICMDKSKHTDAVSYFKKTLALDPENKNAAFNIGISLFNDNKYKLSIDVFTAYQKEFGLTFEAERFISLAHFSLNNLEKAEKSLEILCSMKPEDGDLWYDRGIILNALQRNFDAIHCYQKSLEIFPDKNDAFWNMALLYQKEGKLAELIDIYENAKHDKDFTHVVSSFLAQAYLLIGEGEDAIKLINRAIDLHPLKNSKDKHYLNYIIIKGNILNSIGKVKEAVEVYKKVISIDDTIEQAYVNIGSVYVNANESKQAIPYLLKATDINPRSSASYLNLGNAYYSIGDKKKALEAFSKAEDLDPNVSVALSSKAAVQMDSGDKKNAIFTLIEAIQKDPHNGNAYINLGGLLRQHKQYEEAVNWLNKGIVILKSQPYKHKQIASAYTNLGYSYLDLEEFDKMKDCFVEAIKYNENHTAVAGFLCYSKLYVADWTNLESYKKLTMEKVKQRKNVCTPFCSFSITDNPEEQFEIAKTYSHDRAQKVLVDNKYTYEKNYLHKKPKVAYISNDFHDHATMHLMAGLFEKQNNEQFDYCALSYGNKKDGSAVTKRVINAFSKVYDVEEYSNEQIAKLINELEIDIAIDLKGHTYGTRMGALAHRPAPIQVSYLGHPGTTGTDYIDYLLLDDFIVTEENKKYFSEKVIKLNGCYQCTDDRRELPTKKDRKYFGLPEDKFIFCSFNNSYKIQPEIFNIWMDLLNQTPNSILWLLDTHEYCKNNLLEAALLRGVKSERIIFSPRLINSEHLQRQMCADLFLDTFPICAHTTASDALWVGLPILTMSGKSMVSRVAGSALKNIGLEELITHSIREYKDKALYLANNPKELNIIKEKIISNRFNYPLFKTKEFTKNLEKVYVNLFDEFKDNYKSNKV